MGRLQQYALMAARLDQALEEHILELEATDPDRAGVLRQDVQVYVRRKRQDLLTQLAMAALRTAVMVAQALANQRLVLDQITALNTTTGNLIESTSSMLRQQTGRVHDQAASATVKLNQLKTAFANIYATMEAVDAYKSAAMQSVRATVDALEHEVAKARGYLEPAKGSPATDGGGAWIGTGELALSTGLPPAGVVPASVSGGD